MELIGRKLVAKYIKQAVDLFQMELHGGCCAPLKVLFIGGSTFTFQSCSFQNH